MLVLKNEYSSVSWVQLFLAGGKKNLDHCVIAYTN
jgi:hypothetical protein